VSCCGAVDGVCLFMYVYRQDYQPWIRLFPLEDSHNKSSEELDEVPVSLSTFLVVSSARLPRI